MRIRVEIEAGDIVRAAQKRHNNLSHKQAAEVLRKFEFTINRTLEDSKQVLVANMVDYALHQKQEIAHANT